MGADSLLESLREFLYDKVVPLESQLLAEGFVSVEPALRLAREEAQRRKLWAPQMPVDLGGLGLPLPTIARISAVLGETPLGHYSVNCQAPDVGNMELLHAHGSDEQQAQWLAPLVRGEIRSCFAMTEPEFAGSNPVQLATTATRDGDHYVVNGHKWFTSSADGASFVIIMAVTNADAKPHERASMLLAPMDTPGVERVRNVPVMGEPGSGWASHAEMRFSEARVPVANRIGAEGAGFALAQERLGPGRIHHCMRWIGICERAIALMSTRALARSVGAGETLADRQAVRHMIAESRAETDAARAMVMDVAARIERDGVRAARASISAIKFFVAGVLQRVLDRAIQVHGAAGLTPETPLAYWYGHERGARIYDGPDEVHKDVVAREELKRFAARTGRA